ncbi:hypothetical protein TRIP_B50488 [uncultured Desulfatiglans sp.]|nr:hypothetical protein TRIP_B50488 [uncultured Desulfatiglans sp.]
MEFYRKIVSGWRPINFHPARVFLANPDVSVEDCLCGALLLKSAQGIHFMSIAMTTRFRIGDRIVQGNHWGMDAHRKEYETVSVSRAHASCAFRSW